jgi:adenylate cyclase
MNQEHIKRKLSIILSTDVVGYSRLMEENEASTVRGLEENKRLIGKLIEEYEGRVVDSTGDNLLAEFSSVVKAVDCAAKIQKELKIKNAELVKNHRMEFRIGINLGDVIEEDGRIYGNGVNIAARLEGLAHPGGICISRTVYDQVKTKLDLGYEYLGEHSEKNISEPIRVYRVLMDSETAGKVIGEKRFLGRISHRAAMAVIIILFVAAAGSIGWIIYSHQSRKIKPASIEPEQAPVVSDVEEGSITIAVLPFVNLSSDPEQGYFVDGLSEEILNSLSQIPDLTVIAKTSSFSFKGTNKTIQEIASVLGANIILEGSVRKAGNALRITAQLVRTADGSHLWSETYDRELKDIFAVQEDIATAVADELKVTLGIDRSYQQLGNTDNLEAYELFLVAQGIVQRPTSQNPTSSTFSLALEKIDKAIALDPEFALAWALKGIIHTYNLITAPSSSRVTAEKDEALNAALKAIELEPNLALGNVSLGYITLTKGDWIEAELAFRKALELTNDQLLGYGYFVDLFYLTTGNFKKANELIEDMLRNDPKNATIRTQYMLNLAYLGEVQRALKEYERGKLLFGSDWNWADIFGLLLILGTDHARAHDVQYQFANAILNTTEEQLDSPEEVIKELRKLYENNDNLNTTTLPYISALAASFGDHELAMDVMEKGVGIQASSAVWFWLPVMKEVRQLPRFKEFVREIGLVDYWTKFGWPDPCRPVGDGDFECD